MHAKQGVAHWRKVLCTKHMLPASSRSRARHLCVVDLRCSLVCTQNFCVDMVQLAPDGTGLRWEGGQIAPIQTARRIIKVRIPPGGVPGYVFTRGTRESGHFESLMLRVPPNKGPGTIMDVALPPRRVHVS